MTSPVPPRARASLVGDQRLAMHPSVSHNSVPMAASMMRLRTRMFLMRSSDVGVGTCGSRSLSMGARAPL